MVYATAAKGFRVGGVNQPPPAARCAADLTSLGITSTPATYASDSLWSYEAGAKVRVLGGRAQINTAAFYIDWKNVQSNFGLPTCGFGYTVNAGSATSKGVDMQASVRLIDGLTANVQAAYTDAKYTQAVVGPAPRNTLFIAKGDRLATPKWSVNLGLEYNFEVMSNLPAFVQANYQYSSGYQRSFGPGTGTYAPDTYMADATNFVTARAGVTVAHTEISAYVDNLFNSKDKLVESGGRAGCNVATGAACTTYAQYVYPMQGMTYRPRTFGLTATYRY
jgi:outer membrane receptor protein involved in Fe transport